jgi:hypothetical protein
MRCCGELCGLYFLNLVGGSLVGGANLAISEDSGQLEFLGMHERGVRIIGHVRNVYMHSFRPCCTGLSEKERFWTCMSSFVLTSRAGLKPDLDRVALAARCLKDCLGMVCRRTAGWLGGELLPDKYRGGVSDFCGETFYLKGFAVRLDRVCLTNTTNSRYRGNCGVMP